MSADLQQGEPFQAAVKVKIWSETLPFLLFFHRPHRHRISKEEARSEAEPEGRPAPNPGIELGSPALQADSLPTELKEEGFSGKWGEG